MYIVYILYSARYNKVYVGYTSNLKERLLSHNELGHIRRGGRKFEPPVSGHCPPLATKVKPRKRLFQFMYTVYVLFSVEHNKIYIGYTGNLEQRLLSHNELGKKGWTIKYRPWKLIYHQNFETKQEALLKEKELKSGRGRDWIWNELIKSS